MVGLCCLPEGIHISRTYTNSANPSCELTRGFIGASIVVIFVMQNKLYNFFYVNSIVRQ